MQLAIMDIAGNYSVCVLLVSSDLKLQEALRFPGSLQARSPSAKLGSLSHNFTQSRSVAFTFIIEPKLPIAVDHANSDWSKLSVCLLDYCL